MRTDHLPRRLFRLALQTCGILVITLVLVEAVLQLFPSLYDRLVLTGDPGAEDFWTHRFMCQFKKRIVFRDIYTDHPTRGWTLVPGSRTVDGGIVYTVNRQGHRAPADYTDRPRKYKVLIVGDSFTFGYEAGDRETWPYLLQERAPDLNVINLGVSGYGLDQMYVTLAEEIKTYRPDLVIAAYIDEDLQRTSLAFRDYLKPRFLLSGDDLVLTNVPIGAAEAVYQQLRLMSYGPRFVHTLSALVNRVRRSRSPFGEVSLRLVKRMKKVAEANGAEFLLVDLAWGNSLTVLGPPDLGERFLRVCRFLIPGLATLETRPIFWAKRTAVPWATGHYRARENDLVSEAVNQQIRALPSWKRFGDRYRAPAVASTPQVDRAVE